ncbi:S28 family serine protease [Tenacibaculum pacificus]|uniref:S28 family serine protease n=1 Tax=Tenacibaculum pacificus TaxID=3018314 RepID=UPI0022F3B57D|nr:S28 family serine protease [Tenacibaculum pacificus]WBX74060.1 S28 family serine protease [Tenacibaculum pacificus]
MKKIQLFLLLSLAIFASCKTTKESKIVSFKQKLQSTFPKAQIDSIEAKDHFTEAYKVVLKQNLNPKNPSEGTFDHHMYVSHTNYKSPTVLITDGYDSWNRTTELSKVFKGNQVIVEYRMYGKSRPDSIPWKYLTNDNAIEDYHSVVNKLKTVYSGKWLSSGISKGGETTLIYKAKYPNDIDVAVPYVAPLINTLEDPRTNELINSVGSDECRADIRKYQKTVLNNRKEVLALLATYAKDKKLNFTELSQEEALEYAVLEFPFSFWQWGSGKCEDVPAENASSEELFNYLVKISGFYVFSDSGYKKLLPSFYQHMRELGYYGFDLEPVKDLLKVVKSSTNSRFAPKNVDLTYNPSYIKEIRNIIETKGTNVLHIQGGNDPWGACGPTPNEGVDALKMVLKDGSHTTRIKDFSDEDQQKIYAKLQAWLGKDVKLYPLK